MWGVRPVGSQPLSMSTRLAALGSGCMGEGDLQDWEGLKKKKKDWEGLSSDPPGGSGGH